MSYIARAISRSNMRELAELIRKSIGFEKKPYFPIVEFMEFVMPEMFPGFNYEIVDDCDLSGLEGLTIPEKNLIQLPNKVYCDAAFGKGRARFSVAHEVGHYITIDSGSVVLARVGSTVPAYRNPEWQANAFASEILMVPSLSIDMSIAEISKVFGVSNIAANVHIEQKQREGLP